MLVHVTSGYDSLLHFKTGKVRLVQAMST